MTTGTQQTLISDQRRVLEIIAVILTGLGKFVFMDLLDYKFPYILGSIIAWTTYIALRRKSVPHILTYWGFRKDNFSKVMLMVLPFGLSAALSCILVGYFRSTLNITWHILPILLVYPCWGVIQQFLLIGLVAGNLQDLQRYSINKYLIILLAATLFASVHYTDGWLVLGTFILALFYGFTYLKARNVYVLGILHGWLAALYFYTIVNRDPFLEVFGNYFN